MDKEYFIAKASIIKTTIKNLMLDDNKVFQSSSFQTQSMPLLHILSEVDGFKDVVLTNTGFLFPETLEFAQRICTKFHLNLILVESDISKSNQLDQNNEFYYASNPDLCCKINKIDPIQKILPDYDIWINGIRSDQSKERSKLKEFETVFHDCKRYHPMLDWSAKEIFYYNKIFKLDKNPLEDKGYTSIGCEPCTSNYLTSNTEYSRGSRWSGMTKTECGLTSDLIIPSKSL